MASLDEPTRILFEFTELIEAWLPTVADPGSFVDGGYGEGGRDVWVRFAAKSY